MFLENDYFFVEVQFLEYSSCQYLFEAVICLCYTESLLDSGHILCKSLGCQNRDT